MAGGDGVAIFPLMPGGGARGAVAAQVGGAAARSDRYFAGVVGAMTSR